MGQINKDPHGISDSRSLRVERIEGIIQTDFPLHMHT